MNLDPIYEVINRTIRNLGKQEAIDVLEEVSSHCEAMVEALEQELAEDE